MVKYPPYTGYLGFSQLPQTRRQYWARRWRCWRQDHLTPGWPVYALANLSALILVLLWVLLVNGGIALLLTRLLELLERVL